EELDRLSQMHLGLGIPLHLGEELSEVAVSPPRVGVGLEALPVPRERRLAVALIGGHQGAIVVGTRERRSQADALVEEAGGHPRIAAAPQKPPGGRGETAAPAGEAAT